MTTTEWPPPPRPDEPRELARAKAQLDDLHRGELILVRKLGAIRADLAQAEREHGEHRARAVDAVVDGGILDRLRAMLRRSPPPLDVPVLRDAEARVETELEAVRTAIAAASQEVERAERELLRVRGDHGAWIIGDDLAVLAARARALVEIDRKLDPAARAGVVARVVSPGRVSPADAEALVELLDKLRAVDELTNWRKATTERGRAIDRWRELGLDTEGLENHLNRAARSRLPEAS